MAVFDKAFTQGHWNLNFILFSYHEIFFFCWCFSPFKNVNPILSSQVIKKKKRQAASPMGQSCQLLLWKIKSLSWSFKLEDFSHAVCPFNFDPHNSKVQSWRNWGWLPLGPLNAFGGFCKGHQPVAYGCLLSVEHWRQQSPWNNIRVHAGLGLLSWGFSIVKSWDQKVTQILGLTTDLKST